MQNSIIQFHLEQMLEPLLPTATYYKHMLFPYSLFHIVQSIQNISTDK